MSYFLPPPLTPPGNDNKEQIILCFLVSLLSAVCYCVPANALQPYRYIGEAQKGQAHIVYLVISSSPRSHLLWIWPMLVHSRCAQRYSIRLCTFLVYIFVFALEGWPTILFRFAVRGYPSTCVPFPTLTVICCLASLLFVPTINPQAKSGWHATVRTTCSDWAGLWFHIHIRGFTVARAGTQSPQRTVHGG
jgi:hypothetical protein